jgi:hypothetical protein
MSQMLRVWVLWAQWSSMYGGTTPSSTLQLRYMYVWPLVVALIFVINIFKLKYINILTPNI